MQRIMKLFLLIAFLIASITGYSDSKTDTTIVPKKSTGAILFNTQGTEKMRIANDGRVGIGTASPLNKLHVNGRLTLWGLAGNMSTPTRSTTDLVLYGISDSNWAGIGTDGSGNSWCAVSISEIYTRISILSDGKVGIGTTAPTHQLTVGSI